MSHLFSLIVAFLAIPFVNGVTRLTTPDYKAVNFAKEIKGRKLDGNIIKEMEVVTEGSCQLECVDEDGCLSYNFGPIANKRRFNCQLSDSDRFESLENFVEDNEVLYRGIQVRWSSAEHVSPPPPKKKNDNKNKWIKLCANTSTIALPT